MSESQDAGDPHVRFDERNLKTSSLDTLGTISLLYMLVLASILGATVTWTYRIETTGVNLDEIGRKVDDETQETEDLTVVTTA